MNSDIKYRNIYLPSWCKKCFVSNSGFFWYYFIPKNASESFREVKYASGKDFFVHRKIINIAELETVSFPFETRGVDTKSIVILREPFDRLVSSYCWDVRNKIFDGDVDEYMKHIAHGYPSAEAVPQVEYLKSRAIKVEDIDYVWFVKTLEKQFNEFCVESGYDLILPTINVSTSEERLVAEEAMHKPHNYKIYLQEYAEDIEMYEAWWKSVTGDTDDI